MRVNRREAIALAAAGMAAAAAGVWVAPRVLGRYGSRSELASARFRDLGGQERGISEWAGQIVVCNFWATWCAPCREEIPMLVAVREVWRGKGVEVLGIGIDVVDKMIEFQKELKISYPLLVGDGGSIELMRRLGNHASALPYTVILDRSGRAAVSKLGELKRAELEAQLQELVAEG